MMKLYFIPALALIFGGCRNSANKHLSEARPVTTDTTISTSCPFLSKDNEGNLIMSWVKEINDTDAIMCYAVINEDGAFGRSYEISASTGVHPHGENLPKVVCKPDGTLIAMWGRKNPNPANKYSGLVSYAVSEDGGKAWSEAIPLVGDTSSYDQRYFDMEVLPSGDVAAIWLDSRLKGGKEGSTMFYAVTDAGNRFVAEKPIAETCCPCCRTDLFVDGKGNVHAAFRDIIEDSIRDMVHMVSMDDGKTFSQPERISADNWAVDGCPHTGPAIAENKTGFHFAWYTMGTGSGVFYNHSADGKTFSAKENVSAQSTAKHPQIISLSSGDIVIAWDQVVKRGSESNNMIFMQYRSPEGKLMATDTTTSTSEIAYFPVLKELKDRSIVLAYTLQEGNRNKVYYRKSSFK